MNNAPAYRRPPLGLFPSQPTPRLYDRAVEVLRTRHYSRRTEQACVHWIRRTTLFHARAYPRDLAEGDVNRFLMHLAVKENVAASTSAAFKSAPVIADLPSWIQKNDPSHLELAYLGQQMWPSVHAMLEELGYV